MIDDRRETGQYREPKRHMQITIVEHEPARQRRQLTHSTVYAKIEMTCNEV